jgi:hypothetical protein
MRGLPVNLVKTWLFWPARRQYFLPTSAWSGKAKTATRISLTHIQGAYAIMTLGMAVASGRSLIFFRFCKSPLKWISYFGLAAAQVQAETGRRIETSHW